jgi:DNA primase
VKSLVTDVALPNDIGELSQYQVHYLTRRGLDIDELVTLWELAGIGPHGGQWRNRIFIPTFLNDRMVSWQTRSISTAPDVARYLSAPANMSVLNNKKLVYGYDQACRRGDSAVVVEGPVDVWKLGPGAVHTFGTTWTAAQMTVLCRFKQVVVMFDCENKAQIQAEQLAESLAGLGVVSFTASLSGVKDAGEMPTKEARQFCSHLLKGGATN